MKCCVASPFEGGKEGDGKCGIKKKHVVITATPLDPLSRGETSIPQEEGKISTFFIENISKATPISAGSMQRLDPPLKRGNSILPLLKFNHSFEGNVLHASS
jgi:hypothetical protein